MNFTSKNCSRDGVLQLVPSLMSGSIEREVVQLAGFVNESELNSFVASAGGIMVSQLYQKGARHFELPLDNKNPFVMIKNIHRIVNLITKYDIKVVHCHDLLANWPAYFACNKTGCRLVTTIYNAFPNMRYFAKKYNSIFTKSTKIIAVSQYISSFLTDNFQFDNIKLQVIPRGTDIEYFNYKNINNSRIADLQKQLRIPTDKPVILVPGKIDYSGGHHIVLDALQQLPYDSVSCLFAVDEKGDFECKQRLQHRIDELGLSRRVFFVNKTTDMPSLYALSDIVISASTTPEAHAYTTLEAQSMGRMVIASDIDGTKETIINGQTGWLFDINDPKGLKNAIEEALKLDLPQRLYKAEFARNHIERQFSLQNAKDKILNMYQDIK